LRLKRGGLWPLTSENAVSFSLIYDNLDTTGGKPIVVEANIRLLSTEQGGKSSPITQLYRPNHNFGDPDNRNMFIGQIELGELEYLHPGESRDLRVTFFNVHGLREKLIEGRKWRLQEGTKLVGYGKVLRIVED